MQSTRCPSQEQLSQYVVGLLDRASHEQVESHVDACDTCQATVVHLDESNTLPGLRSGSSRNDHFEWDDPVLNKLIASVRTQPQPWHGLHPPAPSQNADDGSGCSAAMFFQRLEQSGLVAGQELQSLDGDWRQLDTKDIAAEFVRGGTITHYQARETLAGRHHLLVLGSYVLMEPIGAGGMGQVFKACHRRMKRMVAVKMLSQGWLNSAAARARFQREVEAVARLSHPNIVAAHDAGEADGRHFLVMELIDGQNLSDLVKQIGPLPLQKALDYTLQAARGLEYAHAAGIVHRDVKPANLIVDRQATVKVMDLGLARVHQPVETNANHEITNSGIVMGTVGYMAPEQASDSRAAAPQADVYGLGCTFYFLLTGKPPYAGKTSMDILFAHREQAIPSVLTEVPDCPPAVNAWFQRMLAKQPGDRFPDMSAAIRSLEQLPVMPQRTIPTMRRWKKRWAAGIIGLLATAMALLAVPFLGDHPVPPPSTSQRSQEPPRTPEIKMVAVSGGKFSMGSPKTDKLARPDERPRHVIEISPFLIGQFEITQAQYLEVMQVNPSAFSKQGKNRSMLKDADTSRYPVESIRWRDAIVFCNRLSQRHGLQPYYRINETSVSVVRDSKGYRLPTEAEWEYACRAGSDTTWHFGNGLGKLGQFAWFAENAGSTTHPVGLKKPNAFDLYDMHGNVPEWCWDRYGAKFYMNSPNSNPVGPGIGTYRVYRGGAWNLAGAHNRSAVRETLGMHYGVLTPVGIRVARDAP